MAEYPYMLPDNLPSLDTLEQIALAAGHGHTYKPINHGHPPLMKPTWYKMEGNCRPSYDQFFIQTFNPDVVAYLIKRLKEAEANE